MNSKAASKQFDAVTKELAKEQKQLKADQSKQRRDSVKIEATNAELQAKNDLVQAELDKKTQEIEMLNESNARLLEVGVKLEASNKRTKTEIEENIRQLGEVSQELADKKASLDQELEEYTLARKQEIKTDILKANEELILLSDKVAKVNIDLEAKKIELASFTEVYNQEQTELRQSNEQTEQLLLANKERQIAIKQEVDTKESELQELSYKTDQMLAVLAKAKEEHEKFLAYEKKAKAILDTKDRQLQEKAGEVAQGNQFLKNQRSFLPEL